MSKSKRVNLMMSKEDRRNLKALALANTGGNESEMVRLLIRRAWHQRDKKRDTDA